MVANRPRSVRPVHLYWSATKTACMNMVWERYGRERTPVTTVKSEVTCGSCKRTKAFKALGQGNP